MDLSQANRTHLPTFQHKAIQGLAIAALLILTPFAINNFMNGRVVLGIGSLAIVALVTYNGWSSYRGRDPSMLILVALVPTILFFLIVSIRNQGMVGVMWCYPALLSFYIMLPEKKAWIANAALLLTTVPQAWFVLDHPLVIRMMATLAGVSIFIGLFVRALTEQHRKLQLMAVTDPLTGLLNRSLLGEQLQAAIQQNQRSGVPMTLAAIDLDHFKNINDTLGHEAGDSVLRSIGALLSDRFRTTDKVFRLGGEEFLVLLYDSDAQNARQVAEELRTRVASLSLIPDQPVTVSIGTATLLPGENRTAWMKRADDNLYRAKTEGRNRVVT